MIKWLSKAQKTLDIAVFSISHDDIVDAILKCHRRGVQVRIISDDQTMANKGSDVQRMSDQGIPTRTDDSVQYHMHDKFAIVDSLFVLTGSFNWTFSAGAFNQENIAIIDNPYYIQKYNGHFTGLWDQFEKNELHRTQVAAVKVMQKNYRQNAA